MKVSNVKDLANHTNPESCGGARRGSCDALLAEHPQLTLLITAVSVGVLVGNERSAAVLQAVVLEPPTTPTLLGRTSTTFGVLLLTAVTFVFWPSL